MTLKDGPGEGSWSVFAEKVVEERDKLRAEYAAARNAFGVERRELMTERDKARAALRLCVGGVRHAVDVLSAPNPAIVDTLWDGPLTLVEHLEGVAKAAEGALP